MKKILLLLSLFLFVNTSFANEYKCVTSWESKNEKHNLYHSKNFDLTESSDIYKCDNYWMQWNVINTLWWNDKVYISKNTKKRKLIINLWDGDDSFFHTFHDRQLMNAEIDGWNGYDKIYIHNLKKSDLYIEWKCSDSCVIKHAWNYDRLLWNIKLKNIEEIILDDENINWDTENEVSDSDDSNDSNNNSDDDSEDTKIITSKAVDLENYKYLIPAYWWNYDLNKKLLEVNKAIVIVNPWNWDFEKAQEVFNDMIEKTHKNDNLAVWYIYTLYWKRSLSTVKKRIDNWLKEYPSIEWFFFDEVSSSKDELEFYTEIYNYVKSKNENLIVILNPWTTPDKWYMNISDNIVLYETYCERYSKYKQPTWINQYANSRFSYLWLRCSQSQYDNLSNKYKNYIQYFTNDWNDSNTWDSLSKYVLTENEDNSNINPDNWNNNIKYIFSAKNKFNNFLIYYSYPSRIFEANDIRYSDKKREFNEKMKISVREFSKFDSIVWSSRLPDPTHKDNKFTKELIKILKWNVNSYWYIALYDWYKWKATKQTVCRDIKEWKGMWVNWIFFDEASFNYFKQNNKSFSAYQSYIKSVYSCAKKEWFKVMFNTWSSKDIIKALPDLTPNDSFLIEWFRWAEWKHRTDTDRVERNVKMIPFTKAKYACQADWRKWWTQKQINNVAKEVKDEMNKYCFLRSVQDDAGHWAHVIYAQDKALDLSEDLEINAIDLEFENLYFDRLEEDLWKYNKYYKIFEKVFESKKDKILNNDNYQNLENYLTLQLFNTFTNKLFLDLKNKDFKAIELYLKDLKKVIKNLKEI